MQALENRVNSGEGTSQKRETGGQNGQNGGSYGRLTKVEFLKDEQKIRLVSMHLFGKALNWHKHFMSKFGEVVTWEVYQMKVRKRFELVFEDQMVELKNHKQPTNVQEKVCAQGNTIVYFTVDAGHLTQEAGRREGSSGEEHSWSVEERGVLGPYKHPPNQKDAIELMVKELLKA
nr:hypothetical protein [Tanacetum cinerariifolium]